jgi:hypothetical protein
LENNQTIHFTRHLVDDEDEEDVNVSPPEDPLTLFKCLSYWKPPRASTPVHFTDFRLNQDDELDTHVVTPIIASPHIVTLVLPKDASVEKVIEVFHRRTGPDEK